MPASIRRPQVSVLGSAEPGSAAFERAGEAGALLASLGVTLVSGCGSPATRFAAKRAIAAAGTVLSIVPPDKMPAPDWPATIVVPCGMGDARNLLMALSGDACIVIDGWSDGLPANPPDERKNSPILPWANTAELEAQLRFLGLIRADLPA